MSRHSIVLNPIETVEWLVLDARRIFTGVVE
jgi:hypothetical protein